MTSIKPRLNLRSDKQGRHTLILQIIHNRRRGVVFLPYHLMPEEFDAKRGRVIAPNRTKVARTRAAEINDSIFTQTAELNKTIQTLQLSEESFTPRDITAAHRLRGDHRFVRTFILSLCQELEQRAKHGTSGNYRAMLSAFEKFAGHPNTRLRELSATRLAEFEQYLQSGQLEQNTVTFYLCNLRAVYNKARRMGLVEQGKNPFEEISFRMDKTRKRAISPDTMRRIADADFGTRTWLTQARDLFLFSFYARGMSFVDMAYLSQEAIQGDEILYTRRKTGQHFSIRITPPLRTLIDRYAHCDPWLLPVMKHFIQGCNSRPNIDFDANTPHEELYKRYKDALTEYWYYLGVISQELHTEKRLSFNVARHTWASMARDRGIPITVISKGLGHTSEKTTSIYIDELDVRQVDDANDIVTLF